VRPRLMGRAIRHLDCDATRCRLARDRTRIRVPVDLIALGASVGRLNGLSACVDYCRDPRTPEPGGDKFGFQMQLGRSTLT
jgi:hypothetical protein